VLVRAALVLLSLLVASAAMADVEQEHPSGRGPRRPLVRGDAFPDHVLALTWDDGPDRETLALARFLNASHAPSTFFVVEAWNDLSDEPGYGPHIASTGYAALPILESIYRLGHRIGSHTKNHVLLADASYAVVFDQLAGSFRALAPFTRELRMFRAPGGAFAPETARALADPVFDDVVGPVHWDIDAKDWDASLHCRSDPAECERGPIPGELRVKPSVVADRYLAQIERTGHGIVLMHDRVGDVGSHYALDVARSLVPKLVERRFVFAAPVLRFSALRARDGKRKAALASGASFDAGIVPPGVRFGDINGDRLTDMCWPADDGVRCALSDGQAFKASSVWSDARGAIELADVDGDGKADLCIDRECGLAP
jgi:peptidoglycan/xylan/chitin deacetylase (PgdA/CDA1 family)